MSNTTTFNFHIGATRVVPNLVNLFQMHWSKKLRKQGTYYISPKDYRDNFRSLVNEKRELDFVVLEGLAEQSLSAQRQEFNEYKTVVGSQHAMLGHPKEVMKNGIILREAGSRTYNLAQILKDQPLVFHLSITNQYDFFRNLYDQVDPSKFHKQLLSNTYSWQELVFRIKNKNPNIDIIVWDFEKPEWISLPFLSVLFDTDPQNFGEFAKDKIRQILKVNKVSTINFSAGEDLPKELISKLDNQYEVDLHEIDKMDGVHLIRGEDVISELRL